jgi:hypothetical protein
VCVCVCVCVSEKCRTPFVRTVSSNCKFYSKVVTLPSPLSGRCVVIVMRNFNTPVPNIRTTICCNPFLNSKPINYYFQQTVRVNEERTGVVCECLFQFLSPLITVPAQQTSALGFSSCVTYLEITDPLLYKSSPSHKIQKQRIL